MEHVAVFQGDLGVKTPGLSLKDEEMNPNR